MVPSQHEKNEWSRFATAAYANDRNDIGHRYSAAASLRNSEAMPTERFDALQADYRAWLVFNEWPAVA